MRTSLSIAMVLSQHTLGCGGTDQVAFLLALDAGGAGGAAAHDGAVSAPLGDGESAASDGGDATDAAANGGMIPPSLDGLSHDTLCGGSRALSCDAAKTFSHAVCTCAAASGAGTLSVESLGAAGLAHVGVNGELGLRVDRRLSATPLGGVIDGDLIVASLAAVPVSGTAAVIAGDLAVGGSVVFAGDVHVQGDAWGSEFPIGTGLLRIDGDLHHQSLRPAPQPNVVVAGQRLFERYDNTPPCACGAADRIDIASLLAKAETDNDNAGANLDRGALAPAPTTLSLPCGRYSLDAVSAQSLSLVLSGRTAIFVAGDFEVSGDLDVQLAAGAELDLFVGGTLTVGGAARFGDVGRPEAARVYVAGGVMLSTLPDAPLLPRPASALGDLIFVGNLYAPNADLQLTPHADVYGSLFVESLTVLQSLFVHHAPLSDALDGGRCGP